MGLITACRELNKVLSRSDSLVITTYWYKPESFDVSTLRQMNSSASHAVISQADTQGLLGVEADASINASISQQFSISKWFLALGEALANTLNSTR